MNDFTQVPNKLWQDTRLSLGARTLYIAIKHHSTMPGSQKLGGAVFAKQATLGELIGRSTESVRTYQNELEEAGWLTVIHRHNSTNLYRVHEQPVGKTLAELDPKDSRGQDPKDSGGQTPEELPTSNTDSNNTEESKTEEEEDVGMSEGLGSEAAREHQIGDYYERDGVKRQLLGLGEMTWHDGKWMTTSRYEKVVQNV